MATKTPTAADARHNQARKISRELKGRESRKKDAILVRRSGEQVYTRIAKGNIRFSHILIRPDNLFHMSAPLKSTENGQTLYTAYCKPHNKGTDGCIVCGRKPPLLCSPACVNTMSYVTSLQRLRVHAVFRKTLNVAQLALFVAPHTTVYDSANHLFQSVFKPLQ